MDHKLDDFVNVSLRIRPNLKEDGITNSCLKVISKQPPVLLVLDRTQTYNFDNIFTEDVEQEFIYEETVKPLVEHVKQGYNCTVFAYGQTGTGKSYTMGTSHQVVNEKEVGLIPRTLDQFFAYSDDDTEVDISVSFIEIYNEKVFDLLQNGNNPPLIVKGFKVQGFSKEKVFNSYEAKHFLQIGSRNRHTAGTKQNLNSSRSHAVFTIYYNIRYKDHERSAKLNLVDLAGCESVKKTGNQGSTFQEGVNINKGLLCIGQVMTALCTNSSFIPYRQSIITTILQDSLNKKNFVSLIACIKSNPDDIIETVQTLEFAHRVKKMKNKPEVNEIVLQYKKENPVLFNSARAINTPFKKPSTIYCQTPFLMKKPKNIPNDVTKESVKNSTSEYSPKSLFSMSLSSVSSNVDVTQSSCISPVIKKYINAMESSLMNRLETVIKNTLIRPTRYSGFRMENCENKENTPSLCWNKIQNEVSDLRTEIARLTVVAKRAASSPLEEISDLNKVRRVLNYESPVFSENLEKSTEKQNISNDENFKVPSLPSYRHKNITQKTDLPISAIKPLPIAERRSLRLTLKRISNINSSVELMNTSVKSSYIQTHSRKRSALSTLKILDDDNHNSLEDNEYEYEKRRYSKRLSMKRKEIQNLPLKDQLNFEKSSKLKVEHNNNDLLTNSNVSLEATMFSVYDNLDTINYNQDEINLSKTSATKNSMDESQFDNRRKSKRLLIKKAALQVKENPKKNLLVKKNKKVAKTTNLTFKNSPIGKKLLKSNNRQMSPATSHTKDVLSVLNSGNIKQLEKLHSIGPKTAQQVLLFREIRGTIKKISDLSEMPGWSGKKFDSFVAQNFLKKELL